MAPTTKDANSATKTINDLAIEEDHLGRPIPVRVVLNRVRDAARREKAVGVGRVERDLRRFLAEHDYPILNAELSDRPTYTTFYHDAKSLHELAADAARPNRTPTDAASRCCAEIEALTSEVLGAVGIPATRETPAPRAAQTLEAHP